ncbi:hypothetical protein SCHPADRAFT_890421 [Schizopora paradoxa]|uniref:Uncharacterized protein n=1 Tax=Schizopora paradoxa TaxID=27342 RepID=A0A0H2RMZ2_9AGAM|nr:hypothetical protein SCHPADRAFT_890421 [Schizopora paradoxa]
MFDLNSKEEAHHQLEAAVAFTDHCAKNGAPEDATEAQRLVLGYANGFVNKEIDSKGIKIDKTQAMQYAAQSLMPKLASTNPEDWKIGHITPTKAFDDWKSIAKGSSSIDNSELKRLVWGTTL